EVLGGGRVAGVVGGTGVGEPARVPQRRLLLVVPAGPSAAVQLGPCPVGVDHLRRGDHRIRAGLTGHRNAVLDLGTHDPSNTHAVYSTLPGGPASSLDASRFVSA